jgi:DNA-binding NtrC family response regulator
MPDGLRVLQSAAIGMDCVLAIDDDLRLLRSFTEVLQAYNIPIATARDEHEALAAFRWHSPAVLLTDIVTPEQYRMALTMRCARPTMKVIAMSGCIGIRRFDFITIAKRFGADAIVHKPFDVSELVQLLRTFVQRRSRAPRSQSVAPPNEAILANFRPR